jgi:hypothetical protein
MPPSPPNFIASRHAFRVPSVPLVILTSDINARELKARAIKFQFAKGSKNNAHQNDSTMMPAKLG